MGKPGHDYTVKIFLTDEQFVALKHMAEDQDVSQSSFCRRLLINHIKSVASEYAKQAGVDMTNQEQE